FCAHTTCALLINEWEDGALADFRRHLTELIPQDGVYYAHDDFTVRTQNMHEDERKNGHAHVKAMLLSATSHAVPVVAGEPGFGRWQRLILFEMDDPKERTITGPGGGAGGVWALAAPDPVRDGRSEGADDHGPRVRFMTPLGD